MKGHTLAILIQVERGNATVYAPAGVEIPVVVLSENELYTIDVQNLDDVPEYVREALDNLAAQPPRPPQQAWTQDFTK